ncbi:MAG: DUF4136 domain-containing protein [Flavobacteriaceae bacterium]|nr:MAG: DUF4136 domain-containing protein [Flavobacteriaceae bacterium]
MEIYRWIVLLSVLGCTSGKVVYDYDVKTDFKKFKTFNFYDDVGGGLNELDIKRATVIIEKQLVDRGFQKSETPDFLINFISNRTESTDTNNVGIGVGGGNRVGFGISGGIAIGAKKEYEEFIVEFVNTENNQLFWQGISSKKVKVKMSPEEKERYRQLIVEKIFEKYPPSQK